jgi:hypothetical protein
MRPVSLSVGGGLVALALGALAVSHYTAHKLDTGKMVRGELPGATMLDAKVLAVDMISKSQCKLALRVVIGGESRDFTEWADSVDCSRYHPHGTAAVAQVAGDDELHLVHGTWASSENGQFDAALLVAERAIVAVLALAGLGSIAAGLRRRRIPSTLPTARVV